MSSIYARLHGEEEPRSPTERRIVGAMRLLFYTMNGVKAVNVGTVTVSNVVLDAPTSHQRKLYDNYVQSNCGIYQIVHRATSNYTSYSTDYVP